MRKPDTRTVAALSALASVIVIGVFSFWGGFARRWISDDGLIVLRTVRNLEEGNGPVFNAGERVESNTSTLWTYLIYFTHEVTGGRLELVVLGVALTLSMLAVVFAMLGTPISLLNSWA